MKTKINKSILKAFALGVLIAFSACNTDSLLELDIPKIAIDDSKLDDNYMFANALLSTSNNSSYSILQTAGGYVQHWATYSIALPGDRYVYDSGSNDGLWGAYQGEIKLLTHLTELLKDDPEMVNKLSMVRIMKVYAYHRLTDAYGDVPYFNAAKAYFEGEFYPAFDTQEEIYTDMLSELEAAVGAFDSSKEMYSNSDFIYGGDMAAWKKFANSLMLRLAMRVSNVDADLAKSYVSKAISGGVMQSNDDIAAFSHTDGPSNNSRNPRARVIIDSDGEKYIKLGETFVNWLKNNSDPRLLVYSGGVLKAEVTDFSSPDMNVFWYDESKYDYSIEMQTGHPHGTTIVSIADDYGILSYQDMQHAYSRPNPKIFRYDAPNLLMTYAEVELLLAEAALNGWHSDAQTHYEKGVAAAMKQYALFDASLEVSVADIATYITNNPFSESEGARLIAEQYWAATFTNEMEAWANWRRTGYPELTPSVGAPIPLRHYYQLDESAKNPDNYAAAVSRQGKDDFYTPVWWDK